MSDNQIVAECGYCGYRAHIRQVNAGVIHPRDARPKPITERRAKICKRLGHDVRPAPERGSK